MFHQIIILEPALVRIREFFWPQNFLKVVWFYMDKATLL